MFVGRVYVSPYLGKLLGTWTSFWLTGRETVSQGGYRWELGFSFEGDAFPHLPLFSFRFLQGSVVIMALKSLVVLPLLVLGAAAGAGPAFPGQGNCSRQVPEAAHGLQHFLCQQLQLL